MLLLHTASTYTPALAASASAWPQILSQRIVNINCFTYCLLSKAETEQALALLDSASREIMIRLRDTHLTSVCIWKWSLYIERSTLRSSSACLRLSRAAEASA